MKIKVVGKWLAGIASAVIAVTALALSLGSSAPAAVQSTANAPYDHVVKVQASSNKHLYINVAGNFSAVHGCRSPWWAKSQYTFDDPQTQAMMQISLSSLLARMPVHVYTNGCDADGYPVLTQIQIQEREPPAPAPPTNPTEPTCTVPSGGRCCGTMVNGRCQGQCVGPNQSCP